MARKLIVLVIAACVLAGAVLIILTLSEDDAKDKEDSSFAQASVSQGGKSYCMEARRTATELTLENCGDEPLRLLINQDKNDRRKAKAYQPDESRTIKFNRPDRTMFVDARTLKGKPLDMSISLPAAS